MNKIKYLELQIDSANELINTLYESGCLDLEREALVRKYFSINKQKAGHVNVLEKPTLKIKTF